MKNNLQTAFNLRQNQQWHQALAIYEPIWEKEPNLFDEWAGWSFAFCYSKLEQHQKALDICRNLFKRFKNSEIINSLYAKSVYYTQFILNPSASADTLKKATKAIYRLSPPVNPYSYAPAAIFRLVKKLMNLPEINWHEIEIYLKKLNPDDLLSNQPFQIQNIKGKTTELAGRREEWYSLMIRTQGGLNRPTELLKILETARKQKIKWHYNNDIWFARKEAFAYAQLNQKEKAIQIMRRILLQKQDWFLLFDLAEMLDESEEKLQLYYKAALSRGKIAHKLKLFNALANYLKDSDPEMAKLHHSLEVKIRKENNWNIPTEKETYLTFATNNNFKTSQSIFEKLKSFWQSNLKEEQRQNGIIEFIFPHQKSGFLQSGNKKIFFLSGKKEGKLNKGNKVSFILKNSYDKKKKRASKIAVSIQLLNS